jgi:DNA processing protein
VEERTAWIALASVDGIGEEVLGKLLAVYGSAANSLTAANDGRLDAWIAKRRRIDGRPPINGPTLANLRAAAADPAAALGDYTERGLWVLTPLDADFPSRLRDLDPPPAMIVGRGDADALRAKRSVALVGTRRPTPAGRLLTSRIAARLVECGAVVVSGLAIGIDGAAHAAAIQSGGTTVAVIGAGHDLPGPRAHTKLRDDVIETGGALISEYHPKTPAKHGTFPRRNRIIAALGDATLVLEAPIHSGARITASRALEIGRPVFVAPGRIGDWATAGSLAVLRETLARPIVGLDELVEDLGYLEHAPGAESGQMTAHAGLDMLGATEQIVARRLIEGPASLDSLVESTGLAPAVVSSAVTFLLMRGWVEPVGPTYVVAGVLMR